MTTQLRMILVGVIAPLVITAAGIVVALSVIPSLPVPTATHWGPDGEPDGFGSPAVSLIILAVAMIGYSILSFAVARSVVITVVQRVILTIGPAMAALLSVVLVGTLVAQAGLADAQDAPSIFPVLGLGFAALVAVGVIAWFLLPRSTAAAVHESVQAAELGADQRVAWMQRAEPSRLVGGLVLTIMVLAIGGGGVALAYVAPLFAFIIWLVVMLLVAALAIASMFWIVTVDGRGITVRSVFGFPRFSVPAADVDGVAVITVNPPVDFGGWGIRWGGRKRVGVITRSGEALEVTRKSGGALVVTVPQPEKGAALLKALAQRA